MDQVLTGCIKAHKKPAAAGFFYWLVWVYSASRGRMPMML
jgi:hypothetical protein